MICIETKEIFDSVAAAARHYKVHRSGIILVCKNHQRAVKGFHLWYLEDFNNATEHEIPPAKTVSRPRAVICLETGEVFESLRAAADHYNIKHTNICRSCKNPQSKAANLHWQYADAPQA